MKYIREYKEPKLVREEPKKYHGDPGKWSYKYVTVKTVWEKPMLEDAGVPEHGTRFYVSAWWRRRFKNVPVQYRFDPVPGIHKHHFGNWYKCPRRMNEARQFDKEYGRASRNIVNLPNPYDDWPRSDRRIKRSWKKVKKEKQWQKVYSFKRDVEKWHQDMQFYLEIREILESI